MGSPSESPRDAGSARSAVPGTMSSMVISSKSTLRIACLLELDIEFRKDGKKIAYEAVVGDLEDRRVGILVDGDDHLGIFHAGEMLDGAGNADGDIELGRHHLPGLTDLVVVRHVAGIDGGPARADRGA